MKKTLYDTIKGAYIDSKKWNDLDYRIINQNEIKELVADILSKCCVNVTTLVDTNYSTSYEIVVTYLNEPTDNEIIKTPNVVDEKIYPRYRLLIRVSWLGRFALMIWSMQNSKSDDPILIWKAETHREQKLEQCVSGILTNYDIDLLSKQELEEHFDGIDTILLDNAEHNVLHLMFAQYL